ncbi:MAG: alpha/beta hydrolase-fold protein [Acidimicrobiales bacterium]|jgi:polyhydroxybutyrate depolymerase|nr:alpha/beta hydrolase-fold protein [Acidimicrobiales bacterium]
MGIQGRTAGRWWRGAMLAVTATLLLAVAACSDDGEDAAEATGDGAASAGDASSTTVGEESVPASGEPVPSPGCEAGGGSPTTGQMTVQTVASGGVDRQARRLVPSSYDGATPLPVVVDIHGLSEGMDIHATSTQFEALGEQEGFVVVSPNGTGTPIQWSVQPDAANPDVVFVGDLLDATGEELCIDTSRVYAAGMSMGGMMSTMLACYEPDRFAAVAPVSGTRPRTDCDTSRPVPASMFWGTEDPILPFEGGVGGAAAEIPGVGEADSEVSMLDDVSEEGLSAEETGIPAPTDVIAGWAADNGCAAEPEVTQVSENVELRTWGECTDDATVQLYVVQGGGHNWPGSEFFAGLGSNPATFALVGPTNMEIDATALIWEFFQQYQLPA